MNKQKLSLVPIMLIITVALAFLVLNTSINTQAQMYKHDNSQYIYDNNYKNDYYPEPKQGPDLTIQKIKCVNSNINVNGVDITEIPQTHDDLTTTQATNEDGVALTGQQNGNDLSDKINFDRNLVNICANENDNQQIRAPPATLSVSKTISCEFETSEGQEACSGRHCPHSGFFQQHDRYDHRSPG